MAAAAAEGPAVDDEVQTAPAKIMDTAAEARVPWDQTRIGLIRKLQDNKSDIHLYLLGQTSTRTINKKYIGKVCSTSQPGKSCPECDALASGVQEQEGSSLLNHKSKQQLQTRVENKRQIK